jgi:hypothetical protein
VDLEEFRRSFTDAQPPAGLSAALAGLWWDAARQDWDKAHESAQQDEGPQGAWVHAYLHRKEGSTENASYWYGRAGKPVPHSSFDEEWLEIAKGLLAAG